MSLARLTFGPAFAFALLAAPAAAEPSRADLARVGVHAAPGARAPLDLPFRDQDGRPVSLGAAKGPGPGLLVFADYRCTTLCGPALSIAAAAARASGLRPGADFRLVAVGINPRAGPADARAMRAARLAGDPALLRTSAFLSGGPGAIARTAAALGYGYALDPATGQYTHPVAAFVLAPDGRLARVLSEISLTGPDLRDAVRRALAPPGVLPSPADLIDRLSLLCHGLVPSNGRNDAAVLAGLRVGAGLTLLALAAALAALMLRRRRPA